jgi:hypothetical protein
MPWSVRGDKRYFYRAYRAGGRTRHEYLGGGETAEAAARAIEQRRAIRAAEAMAARAELADHAAAAACLDEVEQLTDLLMRATLVSEGYHRHERGEWRKKSHARRDDRDR